ncbi:hypothetical protein ULMS_13440 [Patiriisocius marinistellae]|uniref:Uncharacterized protein n=1 Tax=Patiriisocius marinistellae TaxID=2494560 RepID=A0A5J4G027_9FLAO|nr:hypothetical protein [Patiriisocius marinistellae]GEQ85836.1 hypothetical protein ULMS_13440 [Patiriisocius marinistellae]
MKKITIITPYAFSYPSHIVIVLKNTAGVDAAIIYLDEPAFIYQNLFHRVQNFLSKTFLKKNLKKTFATKRILKELAIRGQQDEIFVIRPDLLEDTMLKLIKSQTNNMVAYYWDSTRRFPRMIDVAPFFDTVYSYDRQDVKVHNYYFLTNYNFYEASVLAKPKYNFFNISTNDYRLPLLERIAEYITSKKWSQQILVYNKTEIDVKYVKWIDAQIATKDVKALIENCSIIVEIQRSEQIGLSFRVFESLALEKKLITTNRDIVNYDFYDSNNILVLDIENIHIPNSFVTTPYKKIDKDIVTYYHIDSWVNRVFKLE